VNKRIAHVVPVALLSCATLGFFVSCKPKQSVDSATDSVSRYAKEMSDSAEKLGTKAGQTLGLVEKKWDYVRLAYGDGETSASVLGRYSVAEEREIGRALAIEWTAKFGCYTHDRLDRYLNQIAAALAAYSERPTLPATVIILDTEEVRCFGAPGGFVLVSLGALRATESESELAACVALGLAHAQLQHTLNLFERIAGGALIFEKGAPAEPIRLSAASEETVALLVRNGYVPADVRSAAREATRLLVRLGYEPGGLRAFVERTKVRRQVKNPILPADELAYCRTVEEAVAQRLEELHAPVTGRTLVPRFRRECASCLPIPHATP
jgi:hypothetical protein